MEKQLNVKYATSQALNSGLLAAMFVFASVYLLDQGLGSSTIGMILALCSVASIPIQTVFANVIDKRKNIRLHDMLYFILTIVILASVVMTFNYSLTVFILAIFLAFSFAQATTPFVNSLAFIFEDQNIAISFGVGRAYGSLAYAIVTLLIGYAIELTTPNVLPLFYIGLAVALMLVLRTYTLPKNPEALGEIPALVEEKVAVLPHTDSIPIEQQSLKDFFKEYRELFFVILGVSLVMFGQTMLATFLIQIVQPIGGDSSHVGMAVFIGALVEVPILMKFDWFISKRSIAWILKISMLFYILKAFIMLFASNIWIVYAAQLLQTGSFGLAYPGAVQYIKGIVSKADLFKGQTMFTVALTMSSVFANFLGGLLIDWIGIREMMLFAFIATCIGGGIVYAVLLKAPNENTDVILTKVK